MPLTWIAQMYEWGIVIHDGLKIVCVSGDEEEDGEITPDCAPLSDFNFKHVNPQHEPGSITDKQSPQQ